jgi:di/tricarboxylate transporter
VAGAIPLGKATKDTGTAELLAGGLRAAVAGWDERLILLALFLAVGGIVQFMGSDSATVALFGPWRSPWRVRWDTLPRHSW